MTQLKPGQLWALCDPRGDIEELRLVVSIDETGDETGYMSITMYCTEMMRSYGTRLDSFYESPMSLTRQLISVGLLVLIEDCP